MVPVSLNISLFLSYGSPWQANTFPDHTSSLLMLNSWASQWARDQRNMYHHPRSGHSYSTHIRWGHQIYASHRECHPICMCLILISISLALFVKEWQLNRLLMLPCLQRSIHPTVANNCNHVHVVLLLYKIMCTVELIPLVLPYAQVHSTQRSKPPHV